jgi:hypothetical protein
MMNLEYLELNSNKFTGGLPVEIGALTNLQYLALNSNKFTGGLSPSLSNLARLTRLHVEDNEISGPLPAEIGALTNLEYLALNSNKFSGHFPSFISKLIRLKLIDLTATNLTAPFPTIISKGQGNNVSFNLFSKVNGRGCSRYIHMDNAQYGSLGGHYSLRQCASAVLRLNGTEGCNGKYFFYENNGFCNCPLDSCEDGPDVNTGAAGGPGALYAFTGIITGCSLSLGGITNNVPNMIVNSTAALKYTELFASAEHNEYTYRVNTNLLSWWEAQAHCISLGGNLVTIRSDVENERVKVQADLASANSAFWIGLYDFGSEGQWRWVGGEDPVFIKWFVGQPDDWGGAEDCAMIWSRSVGLPARSGFWNDRECDQKLASVCEIGARDC